jgi:hypothetical protein
MVVTYSFIESNAAWSQTYNTFCYRCLLHLFCGGNTKENSCYWIPYKDRVGYMNSMENNNEINVTGYLQERLSYLMNVAMIYFCSVTAVIGQ